FENTNPNFPMERGIVLATGNVLNAEGPIGNNNFGGSWPGDDDLQDYMNDIIGSGVYHDATYLEFDFQASSDAISFNFIFASNEYGTYQCNFSDAFAFFLTNTETGAVTNMAVVPGTNTPISVTTIRDGLHNGGCTPPSVNEEYFGTFYGGTGQPPNQAPINPVGQTVLMTASSNDVEPGVIYRMKLVIANRSDHSWDSTVFLEAGSFELGAPDLGGDKLIVDESALCSDEPYVLDTQLSADEYVFHWFRDGLLIPGENGPSLEVTESGIY